MTRARAWQLNYRVKSFLDMQTSSLTNGVLQNSCDDILLLRNLGHEPDWCRSNCDKVSIGSCHSHEEGKSKGSNCKLPQIEVISSSHWKIRRAPAISCGNQSKVVSLRDFTHTLLYLQSRKAQKHIWFKIPKTTWTLLIYLVLCWVFSCIIWTSCWFLLV